MRHFRLHIAILAAAALLGSGSGASAQSSNFLLGKWTETHAAILKELSESYVDSLPVDEIERKGIDAMLAGLDPYTVFIPAEENEDLQMMIQKAYGGIGAVIYKPDVDGNVIINEPYAGSPASKYGLSCGDEILSIDGETVHGLTSQQCSDKMKGDPGTSVNFSVKKVHSGDTVDVKVVRERIRIPDIEFAGMIDDTTGYILQTGFTEGVGGEMRTAVGELLGQGMKTLVLDLRGNGGGLLDEAAEIVSIFLPKGSLVVTARGKEKSSNYTVTTSKAPLDPELEVIVLVDSGTASASEIVSGALQDTDRATIMGQRTFGKGLVQSIINLPYGGELKLTTAKYYTPSSATSPTPSPMNSRPPTAGRCATEAESPRTWSSTRRNTAASPTPSWPTESSRNTCLTTCAATRPSRPRRNSISPTRTTRTSWPSRPTRSSTTAPAPRLCSTA